MKQYVQTEGLLAFQPAHYCISWFLKWEEILKIVEWYLKWILFKLILRMKTIVQRGKKSMCKLCQNYWLTWEVVLGTWWVFILRICWNFFKFVCWHLMVGSRAASVGFIVKQMSISWISLINVIKRTGASNILTWKQTWTFGLHNCLWC